MQSLPAFAVAGHMVLGESSVHGQEPAPLKGHFHPKGKAPSKFTLEVLKQATAKLPFVDKRDFEEQKKGFIAPMKDLKIMADAGHVAWDMERFRSWKKIMRDFFHLICPELHEPPLRLGLAQSGQSALQAGQGVGDREVVNLHAGLSCSLGR